jgi:mono/diheme cytochrome c family protein
VIVAALLLLLAGPALAAPTEADVALYARWCARCHGEKGDGRGPAAVALAFNGNPPRDFTAGRFKLTSVPSGAAPADADLERTIAAGIPGTSMPYFADLLTADEIRRLARVVRSFATTPRPPGTPIDLGVEPPDDDASRARGAALYRDLGCATCHGESGRGDGPSAPALRSSDGARIVPADLTRPWTFKGGHAARDVTMRFVAGIGGTPMPSYLEVATATELWHLAHWVGSRASASSLREAAVRAARSAPDAPTPKRGEYLAKSGTCFLCHVQMGTDGAYVEGSFGAGGMRVAISHGGATYSRNLTPDRDTGLGGWSAEDFRRAVRDGVARDGRRLNALDMPWTIFARLPDADVDALHAYFAALAPVRNLVPSPESPSLVDGVAGKLATLVGGGRIAGAFHPGNAGRVPADGEPIPPARNPQGDGWVALGSVLAVIAHRLVRRRRSERLAVGTAALLVAVVYTWPPLRWMPAGLVKGAPPFEGIAALTGLPPLRPPPEPAAVADDDERVLAARGREVATRGSCSLCHTAGPDPLRLWQAYPQMGGGMRVNWRVFGTTWSRNLTPDRETGLGAWTDAEIRRALTSGIARDGRTMHWQAMPWDHFSHLSLEDQEALVAYLRRLPPARSEVPAPAPPAPGDAEGDTFDFGYGGRYRP